MRTFEDMAECIKQHESGLVTFTELLLALQMSPTQIEAIVASHQLPQSLYWKMQPKDLDNWVGRLQDVDRLEPTSQIIGFKLKT